MYINLIGINVIIIIIIIIIIIKHWFVSKLWIYFAVSLSLQYKLLCTISNNIEVYEEPEPRTNKIPHCAVKFEAGEENIIEYESL